MASKKERTQGKAKTHISREDAKAARKLDRWNRARIDKEDRDNDLADEALDANETE
jgi:hypothetical protein